MNSQKLSISLSKQQCEFIEDYKIGHDYKSRSDVIKDAVKLLQQVHLESCYSEANQEITSDFEATAADGLGEDETW